MQANHEVLCEPCKVDLLGWESHQDTSIELRKINVDITDNDFLKIKYSILETEVNVYTRPEIDAMLESWTTNIDNLKSIIHKFQIPDRCKIVACFR